MVRIAIGIAGKENEHIEILSSIAILLSEAENVDKAVNGTADEIYQLFIEADM
jgi:PTS system mannitol-specific IIA component